MKNEALERPSLKQFVSTKATTKDINSMFLNNTELYNYITALDAYCDELESKLCDGKPDSDTSGGLHLACVNARAFVESCGNLTEYVDGSKIAHRFKKFTVPVIEYNELRKAADDYDSQHVR